MKKGVGAVALCATLFVLANVRATCVEAFFSPNDKPTGKLLELIISARRSIFVAVYFLTDQTIAEALVAAHKRRIDIKIVIDPITAQSRCGKADFLACHGIEIYVFRPGSKAGGGDNKWAGQPLMHDKYAVFDNDYVWTGSFNWTVTACMSNCENVVLIKDHVLCARYKQNFETLLTRCVRYDSAEWHKQQAQRNNVEAEPGERAVVAQPVPAAAA
ncbi:MAG: phospholipase D-like domain-containing protein [Candidatus Babeliales bacterium]|jgi:phosphatidylserine/phosphatidylglycerophosphate/cardiolipin synthase-like enzyme